MITPNHFDSKEKAAILGAALEERYKSIHTIRERIQNLCIWSLGLLLAASGWLIQSEHSLTHLQKLVCIVATLVAFVTLRFVYLKDLKNGFRGQQRVAARIESALGLHTPGIFDEEATSMYPEQWKSAGTNSSDGNFFSSTYLLLYIGVVFLLVAIILNGTCIELPLVH